MRSHQAASRRNRSHPLAGRTLLVTGAASAIPARIAQAARAHGARVALAMPVPDEAALGDAIESFCATLSSDTDADRLIDDVVGRLSRLDALIAVVAAGPLGALHEVTLDHWEASVADPLRQAFWLARRAVDEFLAGSMGGRVVFVLQTGEPGTDPGRNEVVEEGLTSFARSIAKEYGRRAVACNVVVPAWSGSSAAPWHAATHEVAGPVRADPLPPLVDGALFLASDAASFVNGEMLRVGS